MPPSVTGRAVATDRVPLPACLTYVTVPNYVGFIENTPTADAEVKQIERLINQAPTFALANFGQVLSYIIRARHPMRVSHKLGLLGDSNIPKILRLVPIEQDFLVLTAEEI